MTKCRPGFATASKQSMHALRSGLQNGYSCIKLYQSTSYNKLDKFQQVCSNQICYDLLKQRAETLSPMQLLSFFLSSLNQKKRFHSTPQVP